MTLNEILRELAYLRVTHPDIHYMTDADIGMPDGLVFVWKSGRFGYRTIAFHPSELASVEDILFRMMFCPVQLASEARIQWEKEHETD